MSPEEAAEAAEEADPAAEEAAAAALPAPAVEAELAAELAADAAVDAAADAADALLVPMRAVMSQFVIVSTSGANVNVNVCLLHCNASHVLATSNDLSCQKVIT